MHTSRCIFVIHPPLFKNDNSGLKHFLKNNEGKKSLQMPETLRYSAVVKQMQKAMLCTPVETATTSRENQARVMWFGHILLYNSLFP